MMSKAIFGGTILFLAATVAADVPMPGVTMPSKVSEALEIMAESHPQNNLARMVRARKERLAEARASVSSASAVRVRLPLLLGAYSNAAPAHSRDDFHNQIFAANPTGTMIDYYREVSYGRFELAGDTYGWYTAPQTQGYYVGTNSGLNGGGARFTLDLLKLADAEIDFSRYDSDDDGYVDVVVIVHTGPGAETQAEGRRNNIWSHSWNLNAAYRNFPSLMRQGEYVTNDPRPGHPGQFIKVDDYIIQPEQKSANDSRIIDIGVFCHEFGHALGLPDLYDTDYSSEGIGNWGLMSGGSYGGDGAHPGTPVHMCAWSKEQLGWIQPQAIEQTQSNVSVLNAEQHQQAFFKILLKDSPTGEYFLLENRQKVGFDFYLPGKGLLIWHIDPAVASRNSGVNTNENRKGVDLEEADGLNDLDFRRSRGDAGDPFPGSSNNRLFNADSNPNSRSYSGASSGQAIREITELDQTVYVDLSLTPLLSVLPTRRSAAYEAVDLRFDIRNLGGGQLDWQATAADDWLIIDNPFGSDAGTLSIHVAENQTAVPRTGSVWVTAEADSSPQMIAVTQTAAGEWRCSLTVRDRGNEGGTVTFGRLTGATAGLDAELGELLLSPPIAGTFDVRFVLPDFSSPVDFRASGKEPSEWLLIFQSGPAGFPMTLSWDPVNLPSGAFFIRDTFTGRLINIDMKLVDQLTVPTASIKRLKIVYSPQIPRIVSVEKGWNQISLPYLPEADDPKTLFGDLASSAFTYESGYRPAARLQTGKSYWLNFPSAQTFSLFGTTAPHVIEIKRGWNMIGAFEQPVAVADIGVSAPDLLLSPFLSSPDYAGVETLLPGKGYWVQAADDGRLIFPENRSPAAAPLRPQQGATTGAEDSAAIQIPVIVSDGAANVDTLWFGLDPSASNNRDDAFEAELPPTPPTGAFDARWTDTSARSDIRRGDDRFAGTVTYPLVYQVEKKPVTLAWDLPSNVTGVLTSPSVAFINKKMAGTGQWTFSMTEAAPQLMLTMTFVPQLKPLLTLRSPNGGEVWRIGSTAEIVWSSQDFSGPVRIELSRDNGVTFDQLTLTTDTGRWSWQAVPPAGKACLLRISSEDGLITDVSEQPFAVEWPTQVDAEPPPTEFALMPGHPNPFNSAATMIVQLPDAALIEAAVYDSRGARVRSWTLPAPAPGNYPLIWDGRDDRGLDAASGIYLCIVKAGERRAVNRLVLLR